MPFNRTERNVRFVTNRVIKILCMLQKKESFCARSILQAIFCTWNKSTINNPKCFFELNHILISVILVNDGILVLGIDCTNIVKTKNRYLKHRYISIDCEMSGVARRQAPLRSAVGLRNKKRKFKFVPRECRSASVALSPCNCYTKRPMARSASHVTSPLEHAF